MQVLEADDPRQVGEYRLLRRLGAGGMGRVYLGRTAGGRTVAVKVVRGELAEDPEFRARFRQEVAAARRVGGAWTAPVLDADTESARPWVATGYVAGPALGTAVREFGPLPEPAVRSLGAGLAEALARVHGLGLVHRDVKPSNVLLTLDGPRLIDFGIARALDATSALTRSGHVVGSPGFMSPEQAQGRTAGPAGDVFALGAVLAFAATGRQPFGDGLAAAVLLYRVLHEEPDLAGLDGPLLAVVRDCLAKDPAARPTPELLRARLDPDGAAAARLGPQGGWLPPALAAEVGRGAVRLLDLEGEEGGSPSASPAAPASPAAVGGPGATEQVVPLAAETPASPAGGRRRSLPVGLVTGAVVAVLALGGWGLYAWLQPDRGQHGGGGGSATASSSSSVPASSSAPASTPAAPPSATASAPTGKNAVPAAFLGTWSGEVTTRSGNPGGTKTVVVGPAAVGEEKTTSRTTVTELLSLQCDGAWKLVSASETELVFTSRLTASSIAGLCTNGDAEERLTLQKDGTLRYSSVDALAGNPAGTLRRAG